MKLHVNEVAFRGDSSLPTEVKELKTPFQIFCYFFTDDIIKMIVEETNRAALTENINTKFTVTVDEMHHYIGILLYMSLYRYPSLRSFWGENDKRMIALSLDGHYSSRKKLKHTYFSFLKVYGLEG